MKSYVTLATVVLFLLNNTAYQPRTVASVSAIERQNTISTTKAPVFTTVGAFFALSVEDITASSNWYLEKLGLKVVMNIPKRDKAAVIALEGGGLIVELIQHDDALPLKKAAPAVNDPMFIHGISKVGIIVDDFDKTLAMLRERNIPIAYGPFPKRAEQRANLIIRDNAGNLIQFFGK